MTTGDQAFQDLYVPDYAHCYGCGRLNIEGLQIKTHWQDDESVTRFVPRPYHTAFPGFVYGGLIASLFDCHGMGAAAAATARAQGRTIDGEPPIRFVTASLKVDYLKPTPMGVALEIRGRVSEMKGRRVVIEETMTAGDVTTAKAQIVAVQMPEHYLIVR